jgi:hypothetical protein
VPITVTADNIAPTAICQNFTLNLAPNGTGTLNTTDIDNGSSDNCGLINLALSQTDFTCADDGLNTVTLTATDQNGNSTTCSATVTVVSPVITPTFTQSGPTLTSTQTWATYQWLLNGSNIPGANAISYTITVTGSYSLMVTDTNGCSGVSDTSLVTGIADDLGEWAGLSIFPNPARGQFRLRTEMPITYGVDVTIHDIYGHRLFSTALPELGYEANFDIRDFAAGTYLVEVVSELGQRKSFRLVVQ